MECAGARRNDCAGRGLGAPSVVTASLFTATSSTTKQSRTARPGRKPPFWLLRALCAHRKALHKTDVLYRER
jgi:hypothetical protein